MRITRSYHNSLFGARLVEDMTVHAQPSNSEYTTQWSFY